MPLKQIRKSSNSNKVNRKGKSLTKKHNGGAVYTFDLAGEPIGGQAARMSLNGTRDGDCPSANPSDLALGNYAGGRRRSGKRKSRFARVKNSFNKYMKKIVKTVKRSYKGKKSRKGSKRRSQMGGKGGEGKSLFTRFMHHPKIEGKKAHNERHQKEAVEKQQKNDKDRMWVLDFDQAKKTKDKIDKCVSKSQSEYDFAPKDYNHRYDRGYTITRMEAPYKYPKITRSENDLFTKNELKEQMGRWTSDGYYEEISDEDVECNPFNMNRKPMLPEFLGKNRDQLYTERDRFLTEHIGNETPE